MTKNNSAEKLFAIRTHMLKSGIACFIQPVNDEFQNEYLPPSSKRVEWLSGFSGSAGMAAITAEKACVFVDGRYTLQASAEVPAELFEIQPLSEQGIADWVASVITDGAIAADPAMLAISQWQSISQKLAKHGLVLNPSENLIDAAWSDRPASPQGLVFTHPEKYTGLGALEKIAELRKELGNSGADGALLTMPDSICWLLNIRGSDIDYTPFFLSFAYVPLSGLIEVYTDNLLEKSTVAEELKGIASFHPRLDLRRRIKSLSAKKILLDEESASYFFKNALMENNVEIIASRDPCQLAKACKNNTELMGMREAHRKDGIAVSRFLAWLRANYKLQDIDEFSAARKLDEFRAEQEGFVYPSFPTISGFASNGAIVHYRVTPHSAKKISAKEIGDGMYLVDSGGQYLEGTTDITRTICLGTPTREQMRNFTLVLKGHIAIATAIFPEGTTGADIDVLARQFLWRHGKDYAHGTGHGVGCFLSVHEGPQRISKLSREPLRIGMILSNEPGYYLAGEYGIRIESLVEVVEKGKMENGKTLLGFSTLTQCAIDESLVDYEMLTEAEKQWLVDYNQQFLAN
jgi:Xaa-Pro aminopeptidase